MGAEARTRVTIWFVVAAAILGFGQTIQGQGYVGPAFLAMVLASGAVAGVRRLGGGAFVAAVAGIVGLVWYAALVFRAPLTAWSLPTPTALQEIWGTLVRAYSHSLVDYAPVPLREGYAVMLVAAAWVATTIAELTTFRWRRPLLAVGFPLVMFSFAMLVGTGEGAGILVVLFLGALFTFWASESGHRLRSWGGWTDPGASSGALARRLGASCLAAAFVAPLFLPAIGDGLVGWRTGGGEGGSGGSGASGAALNPWVSIVPRLIEQSNEEMFRIQAREAAYWRTTSLEVFDGVGWREQSVGRLPALGGGIQGERDVPVPDERRDTLIQELTVTGLRGEALPAALSPSQAFRMTDAGPDPQQLHYDPQSGSVQVAGGLEEGDVYRISSRVPRATFEELEQAAPPPGGFELISAYTGGPLRQTRTEEFRLRGEASDQARLPDVYYQLPNALHPDVVDLAVRWTRNKDTALEKLVEIQRRLRRFDYTLNPDETRDHDYLRRFLIETRAGYCQQFATAFAVMARVLDFPARVSVGFLPGSQDVPTGPFSVSGTDAHAWPEVYFEGHGWIAFEPTPRAAYAVPAHTAPNPGSPASGGGGNQEPSRILSDPGREALFGREGLTADGRPLGNGSPGGAAADTESRAWETYFRVLATTLTLALALLLIATPVAKEARDRRAYHRALDDGRRAEAAFIALQRHAGELADSRGPHESARAYLARLAGSYKIDPVTAARLAAIYEAAAYSGRDPGEGFAAEARSLVKALRSQLWSRASWWARGTHVFSPRSLRL